MHATLILAAELLVLLIVANGTPVVATRLLGRRLAWPLDGGLMAWDQRRWLGPSKTVRGVVTSLLATTAVAVLFGFAWQIGMLFALASMAGDAGSSFIKRRLGIESSGRALGLDQIPEALLPLLVMYQPLALGPVLVLLVVSLFTVGQILVSPLMFRLGIRRRPY
jgi:hypothetical protein